MAVVAGAVETLMSAFALLGTIVNSTGVMGLSFGIDCGYANGKGSSASTVLLAV